MQIQEETFQVTVKTFQKISKCPIFAMFATSKSGNLLTRGHRLVSHKESLDRENGISKRPSVLMKH